MKVSYELKRGLLKFIFTPDNNEGIDYSKKVKMGRYQCEMHMPDDWNLEKIHPDVLALVAILIAYPFLDEGIEVPIGVSKSFHDLFSLETQKFIYPIDKYLSPRNAPNDSIPGLAYSGGVDSTAALSLLPNNTACFFLDRILPRELEGKLNLHDKQSVYDAYEYLRKKGRQEYKIKTDLEYIRSPRGFPVEFSTTIPALLLSDYVGIDSVATGTIMEHQFIEHYINFPSRQYSVNWSNIFAGVEIFLNQVTVGISEVGAMKIVLNSEYNSLTNSCLKGKGSTPCLKCDKCFRKKLLEMTLLKQHISDDILNDLFLSTEARTMIKKLPISVENVITYITSHYDGNHKLMNLLKIRTRGDILDTNWMEKWYAPSKELIADKYCDHIEREIRKHLEFMNEKDEINMNNWNINEVIESPIYQEYQRIFVSQLIKFKQLAKQNK